MVLSKPKVSVELEVLLRLTAREIQLPPSLDEKARQRYETLVEFLSKSALARVDPCE